MVILNYQQVMDRDFSPVFQSGADFSSFYWEFITCLFQRTIVFSLRCHAEFASQCVHSKSRSAAGCFHFFQEVAGALPCGRWSSSLHLFPAHAKGKPDTLLSPHSISSFLCWIPSEGAFWVSLSRSSQRQSSENLPVASSWSPWISSSPSPIETDIITVGLSLSALGSCPAPLTSADSVR